MCLVKSLNILILVFTLIAIFVFYSVVLVDTHICWQAGSRGKCFYYCKQEREGQVVNKLLLSHKLVDGNMSTSVYKIDITL